MDMHRSSDFARLRPTIRPFRVHILFPVSMKQRMGKNEMVNSTCERGKLA
jgi:hypothetical protein